MTRNYSKNFWENIELFNKYKNIKLKNLVIFK